MDWSRQPISKVIRGPMLHTTEGLLLIIGSFVSLLFAFLAWLQPNLIHLWHRSSTLGEVVLFGTWPIILLVIFVALGSPNFRPNWFTTLFMLCAVSFPFYLVYW